MQIAVGGRRRAFRVNTATRDFQAIADGPLVYIQSDVLRGLDVRSLLGVPESAYAEFSFCTPNEAPLTYAFKLIGI